MPSQDVVTRDNVTREGQRRDLFPRHGTAAGGDRGLQLSLRHSQLAQTTLRSVLGEVELDELLSQREKLNMRLQSVLDQHTGAVGREGGHGGGEAGGSRRSR